MVGRIHVREERPQVVFDQHVPLVRPCDGVARRVFVALRLKQLQNRLLELGLGERTGRKMNVLHLRHLLKLAPLRPSPRE